MHCVCRNSEGCTLILTEGDSAKSLAVAGISVVGRDKYGVFPLKGKMLNVREASHKQVGTRSNEFGPESYISQGCHHQGKSGKILTFWKVRESQGISIFFVESEGKSGKIIGLR